MINGLYSGAAAMETLAKQQEMISANLMHVNSSGHRRTQAGIQQRFEAENLDASIDLGPEVGTLQRSFEPGRHLETGRPLDVAISGDGFLVFDVDGTEHYSRNGRLFRNPETNLLINEEGFPIQGENGPITIDPSISDRDIAIATDGTISANGVELGRIQTAAFEDNQSLIPVGIASFIAGENSVKSDALVQLSQFNHELSNVQPVTELIALIVNSRQYEAVQKATRALSDSLQEYIRA
ncbi:flagellar hook-basal body protein [Stieleria varia]|uniref:Flagellar basal-body rod protein FlgF n=1 Tax=Stieleria varia TaxID=2528005 RepID=A0A5C6AQQ3_9BACT|nr:flagellar hook-basal body complex protein [Stieleria varia]TWU02373.1 Flagellar basal-body rod protein FlgF [Stieleria varia]